MDATKLQETIEQAMKQAMIYWSNSLADTAINTIHSVVRGGYQYYVSAPQPMACQQVYMGLMQQLGPDHRRGSNIMNKHRFLSR